MKAVYLVCFDIEDNKVRTRVGKELLKHGWRVQGSVFEIMIGPAKLEQLRQRLKKLLDGETELRFYRLCLDCRKASRRIDDAPLAAFPAVVII